MGVFHNPIVSLAKMLQQHNGKKGAKMHNYGWGDAPPRSSAAIVSVKFPNAGKSRGSAGPMQHGRQQKACLGDAPAVSKRLTDFEWP